MKQHLMRNINTISRCAALYRDAHLADCGLSGWQAPYIPEICAAPGITQDQLALRLHVNRSNVTRQLAMLEENGSWAPSCARQMRALLEEMKSMEILEPVVTLKSALKDDSLAQLDALRDALIASLMAE